MRLCSTPKPGCTDASSEGGMTVGHLRPGEAFRDMSVGIALLFRLSRYRYPVYSTGPHIETPRYLTLRVDGIPIRSSRDAFESDLECITSQSPDLRNVVDKLVIRSFVPKDRYSICATVTIRTRVPEDVLLYRLKHASDEHPYRYDCTFYGITPLYEDKSAIKCDIIAVRGLASHAIGSWKSPKSNDIWLRDWLPEDIPNVRVLLYGYDTTLLKNTSKASIEDLGQRLLESLIAFRTSDKTERRSVVFIGHSLGGLLIKEALLRAYWSPDVNKEHKLLYTICNGLLFFGVPNHGLRNEKLSSIISGQPNQALINSLVVDNESEPSPFLRRLSADFARCFKGQQRVISFYERKLSTTVEMHLDGKLRKSGPLALMVTKQSATSTGLTAVPDEDNIPFDTDHSGLVKYEDRGQDAYHIVKERLRTLIHEL
ncbi:uncharacterized protein BCR38DRAFT_471661 [Pseudomassariella vexata]|uniref:DUF676 domain-containing protein n=1 Tax=Pseudomassariella vexata TaxID=1141098 RepID=A0A1Y2EFI6_9PEZI|nr:uncharacterized protein BCR38DRAFT_471661 [Pseudomassariella vexata]ORY70348.1 hypothetical protein BCR38DRAFT_471661 [Pseudomassariella vexata]